MREGGGRGWRPIWLIWTKLQLYLWQVVFAGGDGLCETLKGKRLWNEAAYLIILSPLECFGKSFSIIHFPRVMAVFCLHTCVGYITTASKMPHSDLGWGNLPAVGQWMGSTRMYVSNPWDPIAGWFPLGIPLPDCEIHVRRVNQSLESRGIPLLEHQTLQLGSLGSLRSPGISRSVEIKPDFLLPCATFLEISSFIISNRAPLA